MDGVTAKLQAMIHSKISQKVSMPEPLSIQIPIELEQPLTRRAAQLNLSLEAFVLQSLHQLAQETDQDCDEIH
jgi:hypothetical protein